MKGALRLLFAVALACTAVMFASGGDASVSATETLASATEANPDTSREPVDRDAVTISVTPDALSVPCGVAFDLTVVRSWPRALTPAPFDDVALAPLAVRLEAATRDEGDRRIVETRRYRCRAFHLGALTIPAVAFTARAGDEGDERAATSRPVTLDVRSSLDRADPGPPELPCGLLPLPARWSPVTWKGGVLLALLIATACVFLMRARRRSARAAAAVATPGDAALDGLGRLRAREPAGRGEIDLFHVEASDLIRSFVAARFLLPARERTTEELFALARRSELLDEGERSRLERCLDLCDGVKYGCRPSTAAERAELLEGIERFVRRSVAAGEGA